MGLLAIIAVIVVAIAIWLLITANPTRLARLIRGIALGALGLIGLLVAARGLAILDLPLGGLMIYLIHHWSARGFPGVAQVKAWVTGRTSPAHASVIETQLLRMTLDRASGALAGEILAGQFAGARLDQLSVTQLRALLLECAGLDPSSERLLETYLDRTHPGWREPAAESAGGLSSMSQAQALLILGLAPDASRAAIKEAHRRLMRKLHPDHGGTDFLASQINAARDLLLKSG